MALHDVVGLIQLAEGQNRTADWLAQSKKELWFSELNCNISSFLVSSLPAHPAHFDSQPRNCMSEFPV